MNQCKHLSVQTDYHGYSTGKIGHCIHCGKMLQYKVYEDGSFLVLAELTITKRYPLYEENKEVQ